MYKEQITDKEAISLMITFIMGTSLIIGLGGAAKQDAWIAGLLGIGMALPCFWLYSRLLACFPGRDLFDILELALGKVGGRLVTLLFTWYAFHLGALVLRNFGEFVNTVAMPETPLFVPLLSIGLVSICAARSGVEAQARVSATLLPVVLVVLGTVLLLGIHQMNISNLKPILEEGWGPVFKGAYAAFAFPFAETIVLTGIFSALKTPKSTYKVYFSSLLLSGIIIGLITLRNITILGQFLGNPYFPSYMAVSRISVGNFLQRIEVTVAVVFMLGVFIKSSVCLLVASKGVAKIFNLLDYRSVVIQVGLLMVYLSYFIYDNIMMMKYWAFEVYQYYAFPFQVILPLLLLIVVEFRRRLHI